MRKSRVAAATAVAFAVGTAAGAQEILWTLDGLEAPESVYFDTGRDVLYVSNVAGEPTGKDGIGYISRVSPAGEMLEPQWITGLDAPKGLASDGETLWVSDIDRLVAIDIEAGEITGTWTAEGAVFLNDTAVGGDGRVYVSDMIANRIHVLEDGQLSVLAEGEALQHPNGLSMADGGLVAAPWGRELQSDFTTLVGGHLITVDTGTGDVAPLGSGDPVGNLDGLEPDGAGNWIASDFLAGAVYRIAPDGSFGMLVDLDPGSADLEYVPDRSLVIVPMMLDGRLVAYRME